MDELVKLNVGGKIFCTSQSTLTWIDSTFFTSLLSGRLPVKTDSDGAIFIDRDPGAFSVLLTFLRTRELDIPPNVTASSVRREADFFGLVPLLDQLDLYHTVKTACGDLLFAGLLAPPDGAPRASQIFTHHDYLAARYSDGLLRVFRLSDASGWSLRFEVPVPALAALTGATGCLAIGAHYGEEDSVLLAASTGDRVFLFDVLQGQEIGQYDLGVQIEQLAFVSDELICINPTRGVIGVHQSRGDWLLLQHTSPFSAMTTTEARLVFCANSVVYALRSEPGALSLAHLYRDPSGERITAVSVHDKRVSTVSKWIEIAYGTASGLVRIAIYMSANHASTQLFQSLHQHTSPIDKILIADRLLVSVCNKRHVRTYGLTRHKSSLGARPPQALHSYSLGEAFVGPLGTRSAYGQVACAGVWLEASGPRLVACRLSDGEPLMVVHSVDGGDVTSVQVHDCDVPSRLGARGRHFVVMGTASGSVQVWDLALALDRSEVEGLDGRLVDDE